jgi:hypothetical protein
MIAMVSNINIFLLFVTLLLSAPTSSTPVPISFLSGRGACPLPTRFEIHDFQLFKNNTTSSLHFKYIDDSNSRSTICSRFLIAGMAGSIPDGSSQSCVDDHVAYTFNGTTLKVTEALDCDFSYVFSSLYLLETHVIPTLCSPSYEHHIRVDHC